MKLPPRVFIQDIEELKDFIREEQCREENFHRMIDEAMTLGM